MYAMELYYKWGCMCVLVCWWICVLDIHLAESKEVVSKYECFKINHDNHQQIQFIADDKDQCAFWRCLGPRRVIKMMCAPGTQLPPDYVAGEHNPCTKQYFMNEQPCAKGIVTTTERPMTLPGGILIPTENLGPNNTRAPLTLPESSMKPSTKSS